eukprot:TRINITY_DN113545_c0_g1_i1.p1 TRINITY_DN113545_c0_g1~~TRINITY_DN113545_c0_g1_i1.p1  ORF type:complete len:293 (+),score=55.41 TRINITY_DN113545_c0_g1_i1:35-913(+)
MIQNLPREGCIFLPASLEKAETAEAVLASSTQHCKVVQKIDCQICFGNLAAEKELGSTVQITRCGHIYHRNCILQWFVQRPSCPLCCSRLSKVFGTQPSEGTMRWKCEDKTLPGEAEGSGTIVVCWDFPAGLDGSGNWFASRNQQGYLPDTERGREVLGLFVTAFRRKLMFDLGLSSSRNKYWPRISVHIKTSRGGGAQRHGYPDLEYLDRVTQELAERGVEPPQAQPEEAAPAAAAQGRWRSSRKIVEAAMEPREREKIRMATELASPSSSGRRWGSRTQQQVRFQQMLDE